MKKSIKLSADAGMLQPLYSQDWVYHEDAQCKRHLQVLFPYRRGATEKYPLILLIPGSAWHKQEMYNDVPQWALLAQRGYVVAAMEYRESEIAAFPAQVEDVRQALSFIPSIAENFHIDTGRIFLMGNSSGGHIAMMAALFQANGLCAGMPTLSGVICESGSTDLLICAREPLPPWMKRRPSADLLGVEQIEGNEELARRASCGMYIREAVRIPSVLLIHGEKDPVVSVENSRVLYEQLHRAGHAVEYVELEGCDAHGGMAFYTPQVLDLIQDFCRAYAQ